jgi:hypothetical protein
MRVFFTALGALLVTVAGPMRKEIAWIAGVKRKTKDTTMLGRNLSQGGGVIVVREMSHT